MQNRSSTWSIVLAFSDGRSLAAPRTVDPVAWARASALDTIDAVSAAVEPANLLVLSDDEAVRTGATEAGAHAREQGRDLNAALTAALADWVRSHPERSGAVLLGPLPYADGDTISALLRACAATESAVVVSDDGGSVDGVAEVGGADASPAPPVLVSVSVSASSVACCGAAMFDACVVSSSYPSSPVTAGPPATTCVGGVRMGVTGLIVASGRAARSRTCSSQITPCPSTQPGPDPPARVSASVTT